jgi:hypothetical protein
MMNICVLRVWGTDFAVDEFVTSNNLTSILDLFSVWHKGEPQRTGVCEDSGFILDVCEAQSEGLKEQAAKAAAFLKNNYEEMKRLMAVPGVENGILDFAIAKRDVAAQVDLFPAELVRVAGNLNLGLMLSQYSVTEDI